MQTKQYILNLINNNIRNKLPKVVKSQHAEVEEALLDAIFIPYQVIEIDCPQQFVEDNFELEDGPTMGLGKNLMVGFAMSNGNNGTKDRRRRVSVGYDPTAYVDGHDYSDLDYEGGSENSVLVEHSHPTQLPFDGGGNLSVQSLTQTGGNDQRYLEGPNTGSVGESGKGKNMQPFMVTLMVQRITT